MLLVELLLKLVIDAIVKSLLSIPKTKLPASPRPARIKILTFFLFFLILPLYFFIDL
jgi:hypothetical protein